MSNFKDSKLIAGYITKLKPEDLKTLAKFLKSPYHNSQKMLVPLFGIIQQCYPDFEHRSFTREKIYKKLYPKQEYCNKTFQGLTGNLIKLIETYLAHEELGKDKALSTKLTNKGFASRNEYIKFRNSSEIAIRELEKKEDKSLQDFRNLLDFIHDLFVHPETSKDNKWAPHYINSCMDALDYFYFFSKIKYGIELLTRNHLQDKKYEIKLLHEAIQLGRQTTLSKNTLFNLYALLIEFLKSQNKKTYSRLKNHLFKQHDKVPKEGQMFISTILANYCSTQYSKGKYIYLPELVALHKFRDQQGLFLINKSISHNSFTNVIVATANHGNFEWAVYFKDKYAQYIKEDFREDALCLSQAYLHFFKDEYLDTIAELKDIEHKPLYTNLRFRSLSIRAYYELSFDDYYKEEAEKSIQRFITYLKNKNIPEERKVGYRNFCLICIDLIYGKKKKALAKLRKAKNIMFRNWLIEKTNELKEL